MDERLPPIHPGEILAEEFLAPLGLSANRLALETRMPASRVGEIVRGKRGVTVDTALRLAAYFKTTARFWLNLQAGYDLRKAEHEGLADRVRNEVSPRQRDGSLEE